MGMAWETAAYYGDFDMRFDMRFGQGTLGYIRWWLFFPHLSGEGC